jgi:predicted nucleic acid-binding protein
MVFVLDTNLVSELRKVRLGKADANVTAWTQSVDAAVAQRCARLHVPDKRGERDAPIAATALVHGMTVVTRKVADFKPTGVRLINRGTYRDSCAGETRTVPGPGLDEGAQGMHFVDAALEIQQFIGLDNSVGNGLNAFSFQHRLRAQKFVSQGLLQTSIFHDDFCGTLNHMAVRLLLLQSINVAFHLPPYPVLANGHSDGGK